MNENTSHKLANSTMRRLQRTIGLAIAFGSIGSASLTLISRTAVYDESLRASLSYFDVWFTAIWIPVGLYTAFSRRRIVQWMQVYSCFFYACASAANSEPNDLTSLVFFGVGLSIGLAYNVLTRRPLLTLGPVIPLYVAGVIISVTRWTDQPTIFIILWFTGAGMVCMMFWGVSRAAWHEIKRREADFEEQVRLRTEALEKAESLRDRNATLLRELHHRTKNSLQIVASLLSIQQEEQRESHASIVEILGEAERRVQTMAKTHEMFHQTAGVSVVEIEAFVKAIIEGYLRSGLITSLHISTDGVERVAVKMETAIPLGLIINELFSNIVKHAYAQDLPDRPAWVFLNHRKGVLTVDIEDHGIGIPESVGIDDPKSGGLRIVRALADQIDAELSLRRDPFTMWTVRTPLAPDA